jgi:heat shock protein HslJ
MTSSVRVMRIAVAVLLSGAMLSACATTRDATPLLNTYWRLTHLGGIPALPDTSSRQPHFRLDGSRVTGATGCNTIGGTYELSGDRLRFGPLMMTRMACVEAARNQQEQQFTAALEATDRYEITGDSLTLFAGAAARARFVAVPGR